MRRFAILLMLFVLAASLTARTFPVRIHANDVQLVGEYLDSIQAEIDNAGPGWITAFVTRDQCQQIETAGYDLELLPDPGVYLDQIREETRNTGNPMRDYFTYDELTTALQQYAQEYPTICRLQSIGQTVDGREQWMMKITDNPDVEENETEIKLISTIHGNEQVGCYCLMQLIDTLLVGYGSVDRITDMVNNTELWIMPMMNPDGVTRNQRENANDVDLNRDFPDFVADPNDTPDGREPEVVNMMSFTNQHTSNYGFNYHTGSLVVNYPWDCTYTLAPDNDLYYHMSILYASNNSPMYNSSEFEHGVTNGAQWYVVSGGMQDWNNYYKRNFELTIELSDTFAPPTNELPTYWNNNREAIFEYIELWKTGVHGIVADPDGNPITTQIHVAEGGLDINNDPDVGDYHRILLPGTYTLSVEKWGYESQTHTVTVTDGTPVTQDFIMQPLQSVDMTGSITDTEGNPIAGATVDFNDTHIPAVTTDNTGTYTIPGVIAGTYNVLVLATGYCPFCQAVAVDTDHSVLNATLQVPTYTDDFSDGLQGWVLQGTWGIKNYDGNPAMADSPNGHYTANCTSKVVMESPVNLSTSTFATLCMRVQYELEDNVDFAYLEASTDNSQWTTVASFTGTQSEFQYASYDLTPYVGGNCWLRFRMSTNATTNLDGIEIDDMTLAADHQISNNDNTLPEIGLQVGTSYPNPCRVGISPVHVAYSMPANLSNARFEVYNLRGQKVFSQVIEHSANVLMWKGTDMHGNICAPGVYFYRLTAGRQSTSTHKLVLLK